jgi:Secretion system C-terminal sorting domain
MIFKSKNLRKVAVTFICSVLMLNSAIGQINSTLELDFLAAYPPLGPNTLPITVPFSLDTINDNTYSLMANPLTITASFRNQTFNNLTYSNIFNGLTFGGGSTLSSGGVTQQSAINNSYDLLGTYGSNGGPKSYMFTSNPLATAPYFGTGFDVDGDSFKANQNGGFQLFTAAQVLYDSGYAKNARVYFGDLVITFNEPVKNPVMHFAGLGGSYSFLPFGSQDFASNYLSAFFTTELELVNTSLTSTLLSSNGLMTLTGNNISNNYAFPNGNSVSISGEYPINNYGAMSGSVLLNGSVKEVVYKVFLKGSNNSDIAFSTDGYNAALPQPQLVTGATRDPFSGDIWWMAASLLNPTRQVSGTIFDDADGLNNNNITTTGMMSNVKTNVGGVLFVNLLNSSNVVIATTSVGSDGSYLFDSVAQGNYKVQLASSPGNIGAVLPTTVMPTGWVNTGEKNGVLAGSDGIVNGVSVIVTVGAQDRVADINFGIDKLPESNNILQNITPPMMGVIPQGIATIGVSGLDFEDGALNNTDSIQITSLPTNATLFYNNVPLSVGTFIANFDPTKLSYSGIPPAAINVIFQYVFIDNASKADLTPANYELKWGATPLSIQSISLNGKTQANSNELTWTLYGDIKDLESLDLYRRTNGSAYSKIATIIVSGNEYNYMDDYDVMKKSMDYYLVATEFDNTKKSSNIINLKRNIENEIIVYPNPIDKVFTIDFSTETLEECTATIIDLTGKVVQRVLILPGAQTAQLDIEYLSSGVYNLRIESQRIGIKVIQIVKN